MTRKGTLEEADCTYLVYIERKARVEIHYTLPLHNASQNKHTKKVTIVTQHTHVYIHIYKHARRCKKYGQHLLSTGEKLRQRSLSYAILSMLK